MVEHVGSSSKSKSNGKGKDKRKNDKKGKGKAEYLAPKAGIVKQKFQRTCYNCDQIDHRGANCRMPKRVTPRQAIKVNENMDMIVMVSDFIAMISEVNLVGSNNSDWWVDIGETRHVCADKSMFHSFKAVDNGEKLYMGNSAIADIKGKRDVILKMTSKKELKLTNVSKRVSSIWAIRFATTDFLASMNDKVAVVAQRRLEDKQLEEKTNTDCLVKEQEKEYQIGWKIKMVNVLDSCNQRSTQQCMKSGVSKHLGVAGIQQQNGLVDETNLTLFAREDHTFEVEPHGNFDHVVGLHEVQNQDLIYYHSTCDREQHSAWELFSYREDSNEAAFEIDVVDKIYAHESLSFNNTVASTVAGKAATTSTTITENMHQQRKIYLVWRSSRIRVRIVYHETMMWKRMVSGPIHMQLEANSITGSAASTDVGMLDGFDRKLQKNIRDFMDFDYAMGRSITIMNRSITGYGLMILGCARSLKANLQHMEALSTTKVGYMKFTEAWKKVTWLMRLLTELGYELRLVARIATDALVKGSSHEFTAPYLPQQNGISERKNNTLKEMVNAMLISSGLSQDMLREAILTATYLLNKIPHERQDQPEEEDVKPRGSKRVRTEKSFGPDFVSFMVANEPMFYREVELVDLPLGCKPLGYKWIFKKKMKADGTINNNMIKSTKDMLKSKFDKKNMGLGDVIIGIKIIRTHNGLVLSQAHYMDKILNTHNAEDSEFIALDKCEEEAEWLRQFVEDIPRKLISLFYVHGHPQKVQEDQGYVDSGYSRHMTRNMSYLSDFKEFNRGYVIFEGGANSGKITSKGTIYTGNLDFEDVYFVKELDFNLFSVSQMCDKKNNVLFTDTKYLVLSLNFKLPGDNQILPGVPRRKNMYSVDMKNIVPKES
uniref:Integrase catalytic domain-containing protein n=1 Tax=Tanacetum cinerariifolium TaxID=118510 RepID=A0A6L2LII8_TANCI|nr:hypothetical protein [Tanacetum cinerariifolium]